MEPLRSEQTVDDLLFVQVMQLSPWCDGVNEKGVAMKSLYLLLGSVGALADRALGKIMADPVFRSDELRAGFMIPDIQTPMQTSQFMAQDYRRLKKLIDSTKLD